MAEYDDHDLERRLREERAAPRDEFVENLAASVRERKPRASSRPRLMLAFALSSALLISLIVSGGVGAASSALHSSSSVVREAVSKQKPKSRGSKSHSTPARSQYHGKVDICYPHFRFTVEYTTVTKYRLVPKYEWVTDGSWIWKNGRKVKVTYRVKVKHFVQVPFQVRVRTVVKTVTYETKKVPQWQVALLVGLKKAVYPSPPVAARA